MTLEIVFIVFRYQKRVTFSLRLQKFLYFFVLKPQSFENTHLYPYSSGKCLKRGDLIEAWSQLGEGTLQFGDVNGDGKREIIVIQNNCIKILDFTGENCGRAENLMIFLD